MAKNICLPKAVESLSYISGIADNPLRYSIRSVVKVTWLKQNNLKIITFKNIYLIRKQVLNMTFG